MVDIHTHILPNIDDGSESLRESLEMLRLAYRGGTTELVATPHYMDQGLYENEYDAFLEDRFARLQEAAEEHDIPVKLFLGQEIFMVPNLMELLFAGKAKGLNGTRYLLVEFPFERYEAWCDSVLRHAYREGYIPVIAHPERYHYVMEDPHFAYRWLEQGYLLQLNKGSVLGQFGREVRHTARILLFEQMVHLVASDAHRSDRRTPYLLDAYEEIAHLLDEEAADLLLTENPQKILRNERIVPAVAVKKRSSEVESEGRRFRFFRNDF